MLEFKPQHKHDCLECRYLGNYETHDLYSCDKGPRPTVIARKSSDPSDYISGLAIARGIVLPAHDKLGEKSVPDPDPHNDISITMRALRVALLIASDLGLVNK